VGLLKDGKATAYSIIKATRTLAFTNASESLQMPSGRPRQVA
jgi:hypothetical protein